MGWTLLSLVLLALQRCLFHLCLLPPGGKPLNPSPSHVAEDLPITISVLCLWLSRNIRVRTKSRWHYPPRFSVTTNHEFIWEMWTMVLHILVLSNQTVNEPLEAGSISGVWLCFLLYFSLFNTAKFFRNFYLNFWVKVSLSHHKKEHSSPITSKKQAHFIAIRVSAGKPINQATSKFSPLFRNTLLVRVNKQTGRFGGTH